MITELKEMISVAAKKNTFFAHNDLHIILGANTKT